jgi:hypothetical protein
MKTPREILLKRHRSVEPRLDRMWAEDLSPVLQSEGTPARANLLLAVGWTLWRELIWPSRRIWGGLACTWVVIAVLNLAFSEPATEVTSNVKPPSGEELRALIEQQRMLAQLIGPLSEPANTQKRTSPGPRSERAARTSAV